MDSERSGRAAQPSGGKHKVYHRLFPVSVVEHSRMGIVWGCPGCFRKKAGARLGRATRPTRALQHKAVTQTSANRLPRRTLRGPAPLGMMRLAKWGICLELVPVNATLVYLGIRRTGRFGFCQEED